jgi:excisionase family DNA binding protein
MEATKEGRRGSPSEGHSEVVFPPEDLDELLDLSRFLDGHTEPGLLLGPDGEHVPLPIEVYRVLRQVAEGMRQGKAITVAPRGLVLTTQEAADFLGVSRPTLVKMLEEGAIPFERPNRHRRIRLADLLAYQQRRRTERRAALDALTHEAQQAHLSDGRPEDYAEALQAARRRRAASDRA